MPKTKTARKKLPPGKRDSQARKARAALWTKLTTQTIEAYGLSMVNHPEIPMSHSLGMGLRDLPDLGMRGEQGTVDWMVESACHAAIAGLIDPSQVQRFMLAESLTALWCLPVPPEAQASQLPDAAEFYGRHAGESAGTWRASALVIEDAQERAPWEIGDAPESERNPDGLPTGAAKPPPIWLPTRPQLRELAYQKLGLVAPQGSTPEAPQAEADDLDPLSPQTTSPIYLKMHVARRVEAQVEEMIARLVIAIEDQQAQRAAPLVYPLLVRAETLQDIPGRALTSVACRAPLGEAEDENGDPALMSLTHLTFFWGTVFCAITLDQDGEVLSEPVVMATDSDSTMNPADAEVLLPALTEALGGPVNCGSPVIIAAATKAGLHFESDDRSPGSLHSLLAEHMADLHPGEDEDFPYGSLWHPEHWELWQRSQAQALQIQSAQA